DAAKVAYHLAAHAKSLIQLTIAAVASEREIILGILSSAAGHYQFAIALHRHGISNVIRGTGEVGRYKTAVAKRWIDRSVCGIADERKIMILRGLGIARQNNSAITLNGDPERISVAQAQSRCHFTGLAEGGIERAV